MWLVILYSVLSDIASSMLTFVSYPLTPPCTSPFRQFIKRLTVISLACAVIFLKQPLPLLTLLALTSSCVTSKPKYYVFARFCCISIGLDIISAPALLRSAKHVTHGALSCSYKAEVILWTWVYSKCT